MRLNTEWTEWVQVNPPPPAMTNAEWAEWVQGWEDLQPEWVKRMRLWKFTPDRWRTPTVKP